MKRRELPEGRRRRTVGRRGDGLPAPPPRPGAGQEVADRLHPGHHDRAVAGAVQQGHHRRGRAKHPEVELIITDGEDRTEKQVADVENLIRQEVDALLISPKESAGLTGVVEQAIDAGIPVFVLDRNVETDRYTQFVGGDNVLIGRPPASGRSRRSAAPARPGQRRRDLGRHGHPAGARPPRRLPRDHRQGAGDQVPARPAVRRLEAGPGLRHHGDRAAQPTRTSTSSTATTTRWPTAPTSPPRTSAARRTSSSSASTRCRTRA